MLMHGMLCCIWDLSQFLCSPDIINANAATSDAATAPAKSGDLIATAGQERLETDKDTLPLQTETLAEPRLSTYAENTATDLEGMASYVTGRASPEAVDDISARSTDQAPPYPLLSLATSSGPFAATVMLSPSASDSEVLGKGF